MEVQDGCRSTVPFKVVMEELAGVSNSVVGDMASHPNFGLNELNFVLSPLVVNFDSNLRYYSRALA